MLFDGLELTALQSFTFVFQLWAACRLQSFTFVSLCLLSLISGLQWPPLPCNPLSPSSGRRKLKLQSDPILCSALSSYETIKIELSKSHGFFIQSVIE